MSEVLIVSKTKMANGVCVGGIDLASRRSLRLLPAGQTGQPEDTPLRIGDVWEIKFIDRSTPAPFVEDVDAELRRFLRRRPISIRDTEGVSTTRGLTTALFESQLEWNLGKKGFLDPLTSSVRHSTEFWIPKTFLKRYDEGDHFIFWEPDTKHKLRWVGVEAPPEAIQSGVLVRVSLSRPFKGDQDRKVCWLQMSGVY